MSKDKQARSGEFFILEPDIRRGGRGHGVVFANIDALLDPPRRILRPPGGGFPLLRQSPSMIHDPAVGDPPEDLEGGMSGYWLVSDRLKRVFECVDPEGFAFVECVYTLQDGSEGPRYFLCDVVRTLDALDEAASTLRIEVSNDFVRGKYYNFAGGVSLSFRPEIVDGAHVFRTPYSGRYVICDRLLHHAVMTAGIGIEGSSGGVWFEDAADY
ncbi:DUF1629 domain-containing protein [Stenotrophomonas sp.]